MERVAHLVDYEKCLWSWFPRLMGALSRAEGGKMKVEVGEAGVLV